MSTTCLAYKVRLINDIEFCCEKDSDKRISVTTNFEGDKKSCVLSVPATKDNFCELLRLQRDFALADGSYLVSVRYDFIEQIIF